MSLIHKHTEHTEQTSKKRAALDFGDHPADAEIEAKYGIASREQLSKEEYDKVMEANPCNIPVTAYRVNEAAENARNSLDFLAGLAMPAIYMFAFPPVFLAVWQWLRDNVNRERAFPRLALGLPRGFGKTQVVKLFILYTILFTKKSFILVFAENQDKANNIISDVADFLDEANIVSVFSSWRIAITKDTEKEKDFSFRGRRILLKAAGQGAGIRGVTKGNKRPDLMIFDDIQSAEMAENKDASAALLKWMTGTAMKSKNPTGCMYLFIGNMYPTDHSILRKLKYNPKWVSFIVGGILNDGTSLWEELQPIEQLLTEWEDDASLGQEATFRSEVLNDEFATASKYINLTSLPECPIMEGDIPAGKFVIIDPSGNKETSDKHAIGYVEVHSGKPYLVEVINDRMSPSTAIRESLILAMKHGVSAIFIEAVGYQSTLAHWFDVTVAQNGIDGINAYEIYPGKRQKNARILDALQEYAKGNIYVHPDAAHFVHAEVTSFNATKTTNVDDVLDLLTYLERIIQEYSLEITDFALNPDLLSLESDGSVDQYNNPF